MVVKSVGFCNFAPGKRQEYSEWAKKVVPILTSFPELKKITAWESVLGGSPHRVIEWEFEDMKAYEKYMAREEVKKVLEEWNDISTDHEVKLYNLAFEKEV